MHAVIAIFDLGRTNKKFILFDRNYHIVEERTTVIPDVKDEDGCDCEDLSAILLWIEKQLQTTLAEGKFTIEGINFSSHGASLVHLDKEGQPVTPLYDYMKPLEQEFLEEFYGLFGGKEHFPLSTGSPVLGMLNSGIQLYWLKKNRPEAFKRIVTSLHLPQYANYFFSHRIHADYSSIGCHTGLWDFEKRAYHSWLEKEDLRHLVPKGEASEVFDWVDFGKKKIPVGIGMHDSSAALLPFVKMTKEPFLLLSTGTWNITLNPYFEGALNGDKFEKDCLFFLLDKGQKVAASRLFLGKEYDFQVRRLETYFDKKKGADQEIPLDQRMIERLIENQSEKITFYPEKMLGTGPFPHLKGKQPQLSWFDSFEEAYLKLMLDLTLLQKKSIEMVCGNIRRVYISGGFVKNKVFMELLQAFLPDWEIGIAENKRASALGAAIALHEVWQDEPLPESISPVVPFVRELNLDCRTYQWDEQLTIKSSNH